MELKDSLDLRKFYEGQKNFCNGDQNKEGHTHDLFKDLLVFKYVRIHNTKELEHR